MKQFIKHTPYLMSLLMLLGITSCTKMDEYLKYTDGKEILYTGIPDSIAMYSGYNRVVFRGVLASDPKIAKIKIYWNLKQDSLEQDIRREGNDNVLIIPIPLEEGTYNFEMHTYDKDGLHPSVPFNLTGTSYGDSYKDGLVNRLVKKVEKIEDDVTIDWSPAEPTALYTMVHYTDNSGKVQELKIENSEEETVLKDYKSMTKFDVQTYFLPDEMSIDTFKTAVVSYGVSEDITDLYLKNYKRPFEGRDKNADNKWGILVDWDFTPNILNQSNGKGGWSEDWGNYSIHLESKDWDGEGITNGKVYQSFELPAGNYQLECELEGGSNGMNGYLAASRGSVLPDIDRLKEEALGYSQYGDSNMGGKHTLTFSLAEPATVSVGWVVTFGSSTWMKVLYIKLMNIVDIAE